MSTSTAKNSHLGTRFTPPPPQSKDGPEALEQLPGLFAVEERVGRLDGDEKPVVGRFLESTAAKQRVVELRQLVECEHADEGRDGGEQDRGFESHRDVGRQAEERLAADLKGVVDGVHPPLHEDAAGGTRGTADEYEKGKDGRLDAHRPVEPVHDKGSVRIPARVAGITHRLGAGDQVVDVVELDEESVACAGSHGCTSLLFLTGIDPVAVRRHVAVVVAVRPPAVVGLGHHALDLGHADHGHEPDEEQEEGEEEPERADEGHDVDNRRAVVTPARGQVVAAQGRNDDDESFEPHTDVDEHRGDPQQHDVGAQLLDPEELRHDDVAGDHDPIGPRVGAEGPVEEGEALVGVAAVPGHEELGRVGEADHHAGREHDLGHILEVTQGDDLLELEHRPGGDDERHHHRKTGEDRPCNEVGREDRRMPTGNDRHREVEADHRVHGQHQRGRESGEQQIGGLEAMPVAVGRAPTEAQKTIGEAADRVLGPVADGRQVGDHAHVPEEQGDRRVGADGKDVPQQGRTEVRPHRHLVGYGEEPVGEPDAADVDGRERFPRRPRRRSSSPRRSG